jgi:hypothetical protein
MTRTPEARSILVAACLCPVAIAASWLALVALATGAFFAPRGAEAQPTLDDVVGFGVSMAIAGTAAAIAAFGIGGRRRWAIQVALTVLLVGAIVALLLLYFLWLDPTFARQRMDFGSFDRLRSSASHWAEQLPGYHGPLGAAVGVALGTIAGLLIRLGRKRPRLATGAALAILFALASGPGRQTVIDLMTWSGRVLRSLFVPWSISDDQISITAIIFGAVAGSVIAALAMSATRHARVVMAPHSERSGPGAP